MIHDQIEKIHAMLENSENIRPETRSELLRLLAGLKSDLERPEGETAALKSQEEAGGTLDSLRNSVDELESSHPEMVNMVNRLATTLSNMGI